jgi:cytoskeletal protein CcmA (bactofilin family)/DNA-directed RNA polymerase subunit RPC12/RpoP
MPVSKQDKVLVACPHCGHSQLEPRAAVSTVCKECHRHYEVREALSPAPKAVEVAIERKQITCFECGKKLEVPATAQSSMCKWCSSYIDLQDYRIANATSRNFKTKGTLALDPTGYLFNTETIVGDAVIKGRFLGKLFAERTLTIYTTAEIKGSIASGHLIVPAKNRFRWKEPIIARSAEIAGELAGNLQCEGTIIIKSTARMFGDLHARDLVVEDGAVVVGNARIGNPRGSIGDA